MKTIAARLVLLACVLGGAQFASAQANSAASSGKAIKPLQLACDDTLSTRFKPGAGTKVLLVKQFRKGDHLPSLSLQGVVPHASPSNALADLCLVKLLVGPGNPGPAGAPSTSPGIGIEVWLPGKNVWNGRIHAVGGGGWVGGEETDLAKISSFTSTFDMRSAPMVAAQEGTVTSTTDAGHTGYSLHGAFASVDGSFAMKPDGTINTTLLNDFSWRALHEQIVATKALAEAYYGSPAKYSYWDGSSNGGRQALKIAQHYPEDFDGIIAGLPAIYWTKFGIAGLYPQIVVQRDLGGKYLSVDQLNLVSNAAIAACDVVNGQHLGFILDIEACRYDPLKDANVLCTANGGANGTPACLAPEQALAINKIWYGMTTDGSVPDPAVDNGFGPLTGKHKWYGMPRGTNLLALLSQPPLQIMTDNVALALQDPTIASKAFRNAKSNGMDGWKSLSYEQLSKAFDAGIALQPQLGFINTDNPDLSAFKARGGKLIHVHGTSDGLIPHMGSVQYYEQVVANMTGLAEVQSFYRFYVIPSMAHGPYNGTTNQTAHIPLPAPFKAETYKLMTDWVEKGVAPENIVLTSPSDSLVANTLPMCAYPKKATHIGGDIHTAQSYACR